MKTCNEFRHKHNYTLKKVCSPAELMTSFKKLQALLKHVRQVQQPGVLSDHLPSPRGLLFF